jgi:hypothetical protein
LYYPSFRQQIVQPGESIMTTRGGDKADEVEQAYDAER